MILGLPDKDLAFLGPPVEMNNTMIELPHEFSTFNQRYVKKNIQSFCAYMYIYLFYG